MWSLDLLQPDDVILAELANDLKCYGAKLDIPGFTRGKKHSRRPSGVRIHVELVNGLLKMKYKIRRLLA